MGAALPHQRLSAFCSPRLRPLGFGGRASSTEGEGVRHSPKGDGGSNEGAPAPCQSGLRSVG
ncbi:MAG: hypothetical protein QOF14_191 [Hyphomicrobiales bacterium]|jgi:hypothetical protein|nr:hypothetical protein [Hyphomicrobiales bacterium]